MVGTPFYLMGYVRGDVYKLMQLPELGEDRGRKRDTVMAMINVLAQIHSVDVDAHGLSDYGKKGLSF